ncbi:MAG: hypothetical protein ACXADD_16735 [Candidatus Thorarchaeota archaeon]
MRQTQVEFETPAPTPYGDFANFTITYVDIAGSIDYSAPNATLTLFYFGSPIPLANYTLITDGEGNFNVSLFTGFFSEPGLYELNASLVYSGSYFRQDAYAVRSINVRFRSTILSAEPVGQIGYGTQMQITLFFQDILTLTNVANTSATTNFGILTVTGTPWAYTIQWQPGEGTYLLQVETAGQPSLTLGDHTIRINMSYVHQDPFYWWDDAYIQFTIRLRTSSLDIQEAPVPTPFGENATFIVYYWDADATQGILGATISLEIAGPLVLGTDYYITEGLPGVYNIFLDSAVLGSLGTYEVKVTAIWPGGPPFHNNAARNTTVVVIGRTAAIEITGPPTQPRYLDNMTFTFSYVDSINGSLITGITSSDISLYANGSLLTPMEFVMTEISSRFEVSINSTILGATLVTDLNLTIIIDWNDFQIPFYTDDGISMKVSTRGRAIFIEPQQIDTTPINDDMIISFFLTDEDNGNPISNATILFSCQTRIITGAFTISEGVGSDEGLYTITLNTAALLSIGDYVFDLEIQWNPAQIPFYANRSPISLTGSVDLIWAILQSQAPQPASVQITGDVYVIVEFKDLDHSIGINGSSIIVEYLDTRIVPQGLSVNLIGSGIYNISFSTIDLDVFGSQGLNITAVKSDYTSSTVTPTFAVIPIKTILNPHEASIALNWSESALVTVDFQNLLFDNLTSGATVTWFYGTGNGTFTEIGNSGIYEAWVDSTFADSGTRSVTIIANKSKYIVSIASVTLVANALPSEITLVTPEAFFEHPRGGIINVTIFLIDTYNGGITIDMAEVNSIVLAFEEQTPINMEHNSTDNSWYATLPSSATSNLEPNRVYTARISVVMKNYDATSTVFKLDLQASETTLHLVGETQDRMDAVFSEIITFTLTFNETESGTPIDNGTIKWVYSGFGINYNFTYNNLTKMWELSFDTSEMAFGTWGLAFFGTPADSNLADDVVTLTITIRKITTEAIPSPTNPSTVFWGWAGNISFYYNDTDFNNGVVNATAEYQWGNKSGDAIDLGDGWYVIPINSSHLASGQNHPIAITFNKENYIVGIGAIRITVNEVPTELILESPVLNQIDNDTTDLQVPLGDSIVLTYTFNDTDYSDGYIGGLSGAEIEAAVFGGGLAGGDIPIEVNHIGNGSYTISFNTLDARFFEVFSGLPRSLPNDPYFLKVTFELENYVTKTLTIRILIIEVPTGFEILSYDSELMYGETGELVIRYYDAWEGHDEAPIVNANLSIAEGFSSTFIDGIVWSEDPTQLGIYIIQYSAMNALIGTSEGTVEIPLEIFLIDHELQVASIQVHIYPTPLAESLTTALTLGTPLLFVVLVLLGAYVRIWSVPKRIRQMCGQIKRLSKGKIPKPIDDVYTRQELVAGLFNDTYSELEITRAAREMPEESIEVAVPEMGELLIQLSILTNLSAEELEEFQSDISKMRISEQAAFVREVIDQEAVRVARRDNKTPAEIIEDTRLEALAILRGEKEDVDARVIISEPEDEPVVLIEDRKPETPTVLEDEEAAPADEELETEIVVGGEKLSDYEIEELRKELESRGIPPHEIDTIMEQARVLPRELVEELVRSLSGDED